MVEHFGGVSFLANGKLVFVSKMSAKILTVGGLVVSHVIHLKLRPHVGCWRGRKRAWMIPSQRSLLRARLVNLAVVAGVVA